MAYACFAYTRSGHAIRAAQEGIEEGTRTTSLIFLVALPSVLEGVALLALRLRLGSMAGALQSGWIGRIYGQRLQSEARALYATEE